MINSLFIEMTYSCNYQCTFCSMADKDHKLFLDIKEIAHWLIKNEKYFKFKEIYIEGGEPLLIDPQVYLNMLAILNPKTKLVIQTNGELFYKDPEKWLPLIETNRVSFATSFQLGAYRKNKDGTILTTELFNKYQEKFKQFLNTYVDFTYVLTDDNSSNTDIDILADIIRKYKVNFEINAIRYEGGGKACYVPIKRFFQVLNYIISKHKDIVKNCTTLTGIIKYYNKSIFGENMHLFITPNGDIITPREKIGCLNDNINNVYKNFINSEKLCKARREKCDKCFAYNYCNVYNYMLKGMIKNDKVEQQDACCIEIKKLIDTINKLQGKLKI